MITLSFSEFAALVALRQRASIHQEDREVIVRPDQIWPPKKQQQKHLATCPACDAVVDADLLDVRSGLCPRCHAESQQYR